MRPSRRRLVAAYLLGNYVFLLAGIPLPLPVEKDVSRPFPCQHHQCGCATADQCWRSCCCYSHEEKLAWAREHGVSIPTELLAESRKNSSNSEKCCDSPAVASATPHLDAHCRHERTCCSHTSEPTPTQRDEHNDADNTTEGIVGIRAIACQGGSAVWIMLATTTLPQVSATFELELASSELSEAIEVPFHGLLWAPEPPPPRA